jgi:hypothetical protein
MVRYADDMLVLFEREDDAHRLMRVLATTTGKIRVNAQPSQNSIASLWQTSRLAGNRKWRETTHL